MNQELQIINFGSGSKGNSTLIKCGNTKILIDCGISLKRILEILRKKKIETNVDAILITHEHSDHIAYLSKYINKFKCPVYMDKASFDNIPSFLRNDINASFFCFIEKNVKFQIKDLIFVPLELYHDTKCNYGYLIKIDKFNIGYLTDTGIVPNNYYNLLRQMDVLIIESNHDVEMLLESNRPYILKRRILSDHGHLSNEQCHDLLNEIITKNTKVVMLAHLSEECNDPSIAYDSAMQVINDKNKDTKLLILSQHQETEVIIDA